MAEFKDADGVGDVAFSYTAEEGMNRAAARRAGQATESLEDTRRAEVGYFTAHIDIDKSHSLQPGQDGKWHMIVDNRPTSEEFENYNEYRRVYDEMKANGEFVYETWTVEVPEASELPVNFGGRGEDVIAFKANGWGLEKIQKIHRHECETCPSCARRLDTWLFPGQPMVEMAHPFPKRSPYGNVKDEDAGQEDVLDFYGFRRSSLRVLYDVEGNREIDYCENAVCRWARKETEDPQEFHLWVLGSERRVRVNVGRRLTAREAMSWAEKILMSWPVHEVLIEDKDDFTTFLWKFNEGICFPDGEEGSKMNAHPYRWERRKNAPEPSSEGPKR